MDTSNLTGLYFNRMIFYIILIRYGAVAKLYQVEIIHLMEREGNAQLHTWRHGTVALVWSLNIIWSEQ